MINKNKIKLISFDAADTLIKLAKSVGDHYAYIASRHGIVAKAEDIDQSFKKVFSQMPPLGSDGQKGFLWWKIVLSKTFESLGFREGDFENFEDFVNELYLELAKDNAWVIYPAVEPTLRELKNAGFKMVVFSNFDERLLSILNNLNLTSYFEQIICSTQIGYAKPDPKAFLKLAQIVQLKPEQIIHIGDGFENDYLGALKAGFEAIYLNRSKLTIYKPLNPKHEIAELSELIVI